MSEQDTVAFSICCRDDLAFAKFPWRSCHASGFALPDPVITGIAVVHRAGSRVDDHSLAQMAMGRTAVYGSV
jgi:hypothetical protein